MEPVPVDNVRLEFPFTVWNRVWANLVLIPQRKIALVLHFIFPVVGVYLLYLMLTTPRPSLLPNILLVVVCFGFSPIIVFIGVLTSHLTNKTFREPFTYTFDSEGIHVHAATYKYSNPWSAIIVVKPMGGFLMFFFAPGCAHAIPLKVIHAANQYDHLRLLARAHGVKVI